MSRLAGEPGSWSLDSRRHRIDNEASETPAASMVATLDAYMQAFNANALDGVMTHFADDVLYCPGNGAERVGRAAIRQEFEPQFKLALGAMRFDDHTPGAWDSSTPSSKDRHELVRRSALQSNDC